MVCSKIENEISKVSDPFIRRYIILWLKDTCLLCAMFAGVCCYLKYLGFPTQIRIAWHVRASSPAVHLCTKDKKGYIINN